MSDYRCDGQVSEGRPCAKWMTGPTIEPLELPGNEPVADMIDKVFARSGFNARRLAEGADLYRRMIDEGATIALTVAGAMTPIGMSGIFIELMKRGFVDFIVSTGANLYHDLHRPYNHPMCQGEHEVDDNALAEDGVARIYDVYIEDETTLFATDRAIFDAVRSIDTSKPFSTAWFHRALGQRVLETAPAPEKSFVAQAASLDVPIYTSSPGDSGIGLNLLVPHMYDKTVPLNPIQDILETTAIVRGAKKNGVVEIGGGSPKNFYLQTQPALQQFLKDMSHSGHDYFLQLTTDAPHWGGLSGATPSEAKTWGKLRDAHHNNVVVYSCASLTFPLIAQYVLSRCKPRPLRRIHRQLDELVVALKAIPYPEPDLYPRSRFREKISAAPE